MPPFVLSFCLNGARVVPVLLFVLYAFQGRAQDAESLTRLQQLGAQKQYEAAIELAREMTRRDSACAEAYEVTGRCYAMLSLYDSAILYFERAILLDADTSYVSAWGHANLGYVLLKKGNKERAVSELNRCVALGMTANSVTFAGRVLDSLGYEPASRQYPKNYLPSWVVIEGRNISFSFQDTAGISRLVRRFMRDYDDAYDTLNAYFHAKLPKKMVVYHWRDEVIAKKILHRRLAFAMPAQCFCHIGNGHAAGNVIAYLLSYWAWGKPAQGYSKFISGGIAVCHDLSNRDYYADARQAVEREKEHDVMDIWENEKRYDDDIPYPVAGAFVYYLKGKLDPEQFRSVVKEQTLDNVKVILGAKFYEVIADFNRIVGMQ